eukprot:30053-Pelagococcus_subviridis.AAC.3
MSAPETGRERTNGALRDAPIARTSSGPRPRARTPARRWTTTTSWTRRAARRRRRRRTARARRRGRAARAASCARASFLGPSEVSRAQCSASQSCLAFGAMS